METPQQPAAPDGPPPNPFQPPAGSQQPPAGFPQPPLPGQPYPPFGRPPLNGTSVGSLVLGILCCVPLVGLILGIIALRQINRTKERGRSLAVTGIALSAAGTLFWVYFFTSGASGEFMNGFRQGLKEHRQGSFLGLAKSDCFDVTRGSLQSKIAATQVVDCTRPHDGEVSGTFEVTGAYPGDSALHRTARQRCLTDASAYAMDSWAIPEGVRATHVIPSPDTWRLGDRTVTCLFAKEGGKATGTLRRDATSLDSDQLAYLGAVNKVNLVMDEEPQAKYIAQDLAGYQAWARKVSAALGDETRLLNGHHWPATARGPVSALVTTAEEARTQWTQAAASRTATAYYAHYDKGWKLLTPGKAIPARKALGLATSYRGETAGGSQDNPAV